MWYNPPNGIPPDAAATSFAKLHDWDTWDNITDAVAKLLKVVTESAFERALSAVPLPIINNEFASGMLYIPIECWGMPVLPFHEPDAIVPNPSAWEDCPIAVEPCPSAWEANPIAVVWIPSAWEYAPIACVKYPSAWDHCPIAFVCCPSAWDHCPIAVVT